MITISFEKFKIANFTDLRKLLIVKNVFKSYSLFFMIFWNLIIVIK